MNVMLRSIILTVLLVALGAPAALALSPPHDASNGISCANCHYAGASINSIGFTNMCHSCHKPGGMAQLQPFSPVDASNIFLNVTSKRVGTLLNTSHNFAGGLVEPRAGAVAPTNASLNYTPLTGLSCARCHAVHNPLESATNSAPFLRMLNDRDQLCLDCHSPRNTTNQVIGSHPVTMTYTTAIKKFASYTTKFYTTPVNANPANPTSAMNLSKGGQILCSTCHSVHYADSNSATFDTASSSLRGILKPSEGNLLRTDMRGATPNATNICTNCHKGYTAHNGKGQNVQCADCHGAHVDEADGTTPNVWLVRRYMTYSTALTGKVDNRKLLIATNFQSTAFKRYTGTMLKNYEVVDSGVCRSCHALPIAVPEHTATGTNCNTCHTHANAWSPAGGGSCTSCHGQPPSVNTAGGPNGYAGTYGTTSGVDESTTAHVSHATTLGYACAVCHNGATHQGGFVQKLVFISGGMAFNNGATPNYDKTLHSCSTTYCHSNGAVAGRVSGAPVYTTPAWANGKGTIIGTGGECSACHGGSASSGKAMATGSHTAHVGAYSLGCKECHINTTTDGKTLVAGGAHLNGTGYVNGTDVKFDTAGSNAAGVYTSNVGNLGCTATYCHSRGTSSTVLLAPFTSARWGAKLPADCTGCHGGDATTGAKKMATGAHGKHINGAAASAYGIGCADCHNLTAISNTSVNVAGGNHVNNAINVDLSATYGGTYSTNGHAPGGAVGTCSGVYCHSNGQTPPGYVPLAWNAPTPLGCTACHGDATSTTPAALVLSGKHAAHLNPAANTSLGAGNGFGCVDCHAKTVSNNTTISATGYALHVNKLVDYSGAKAGGSAKYNATTHTCTTNYCHSNGNPAALAYVNPPAWNSATPLSCNGCHGTSNIGAPDYANGGAGTATANSHPKHVSAGGITSTIGCAACHVKTVDQATANKFKDYSAKLYHLNGSPNVYFKTLNGKTGTWNGATCAATYCHGTAASAAWGSPSLACNACHAANNALPGAHALHYASAALPNAYGNYSGNLSTATAYRFTCGSCHSAKKGALHANGPANGTGAADVFYGFTSATMKGGVYTYGALQGNDNGFNWSNGSTTCNTTYCHSNGAGASGYTTVAWNGATTGCTACHGDATTAGKLLNTGAHQQHVNNSTYLGSNFGCVDCHAKTVTDVGNLLIADKRLHVNKFVEYSGLRAGKQINFNKTTGVCSDIYCHSDGKGNKVATPAWTATALPAGLACNGCHANTSPSHPSHVVTHGITCDKCHSNTAASNTALKAAPNAHINGRYNESGTDVKFATFSSAWKATYVSAGKTCSTVYCHSDGHGGYQTVTWGATLNCNSCHPFNALSAGHAKHIDLNQTAVFYTYTANRSSGDEGLSNAVYRFGCSNCHPVNEAAFHGNGVIDVTLKPVAGAGSLKNKNVNITADGVNVAGSHVFKTGNTLTCDNVYCHTNGYATSINWSNVTPAWTGSFANADRCANCHGNSPSVGIAGSPAHAAHVVGIHSDDIFTGTTGKLAAGRGGAFGNTTSVSHGSSVQATTINCNICHNTTVTYARNDRNSSCSTTGCHTTFTRLAQINNRANHVNGKVDLAFWNTSAVKSKAQLRDSAFADYTAAGGSWTRSSYKAGAASFDTAKRALSNTMYSGGNCSNIACHNGRPVNWTSDVGKGKDCTICHSRL